MVLLTFPPRRTPRGVGGLTGLRPLPPTPKKKREAPIAADVSTFFETHFDSKHEIITFVSNASTQIALPFPKLIENRPLGQILASKVAQNRRLSPRSCPKSSLERPKSSLAHPKGALCRPNLVPGGSQPLPGGPWGSPGPSKTSIFLKERLTFPLCAPQRSHTILVRPRTPRQVPL